MVWESGRVKKGSEQTWEILNYKISKKPDTSKTKKMKRICHMDDCEAQLVVKSIQLFFFNFFLFFVLILP